MDELEEELKRNKGTPKPEQSMRFYKSGQLADKTNKIEKGAFYKSSFHSQTGTKHSLEHMNRKSKVTYLLVHDSKVNENKSYENIEQFKEQAEKIYKEKIGQKIQPKAKENLIKEAVLNTKPNTTIEDIENTFKNLNKRFSGHHILATSIHRDEGVFIDTKYDLKDLEYTAYNLSWKHINLDKDVTNEVIDYAPNRNIFYNQADKNWYFDKQYENKADISEFQQKINYHAHVLYSNFNKDTGKTARLDRNDMRELQTIVADSLGMQRGTEFSKNKRMNHWQLKRSIDAKRELKLSNQSELAKQKDLQNEMRVLREELKTHGTAKREDFAQLEQINKDLKNMIQFKELNLKDLQTTLNEKLKTIDYINGKLDSYKERERNQELYIGNKIPKERIKIKDGLLTSKEVYVYKTEAVENFITKASIKEEQLTKDIESLTKERGILKEKSNQLDNFKIFIKKYLNTSDIETVKEFIKEISPAKFDKNKSIEKDRGFERD